ncbi:DUF2301 domain-containing membrane protein [Vibrio ezurae]|uniref:Uncharacterized protein n=1 Tax=Vibrio ezurae NBRC 102218 TaxID=1219080 RepID=U3AZF3_9VIBR|nr:DUF2301 domain-containing membrane protein [Vibrio ezurae]GAD79120.1 hypothetical protein VEZ01S_08_01560 [Vibrio ezurae NBRC 102218]
MANPEYQESLDGVDKISVVIYRIGITLVSVSLLMIAVAELLCVLEHERAGFMRHLSIHVVAVAVALCAATIHIYDKNIRTLIVWSGWLGLVTFITLPAFDWLFVGFFFMTFSGVALKESYCFKIKGLTLVPLLLVLSVLVIWMKDAALLVVLTGLCGAIFAFLAFKKWQMPLHFDIGKKSNYQI